MPAAVYGFNPRSIVVLGTVNQAMQISRLIPTMQLNNRIACSMTKGY